MPLTLPGLFDFTTGVNSAITQQSNRATASSNEALSFVNQLNAFNTSLNTNDNLEFRQDFANQDPNTSILDRFTNIAQNSNNPFNVNQAVTQQQSLAPLLALSAQQNPFFGQQQNLPTNAQGALDGGYLGFQGQFDQQANLGILQALGINNQAPNVAQNAESYGQAELQRQQNASKVIEQQGMESLRKQLAAVQKENAKLVKAQNANVATTPNTAAPLVLPSPATRGTGLN